MKEKGNKTTVLTTQKKDEEPKFSPHGYRIGCNYGIIDKLASRRPIRVSTLIKQVREKTGQSEEAAVFALKVVCNPNQKSNGKKTKNVFGTLTKKVDRVHLVAVEG